MKIRMLYPFVNIVACIILFFMAWGFTRSNATITDNFLEYTIHPVGIIAWLCLVVFLLVVVFIIKRHNKKNPDKKVNTFSMIPPEYNEDDEMYQYATMKATRKVYTFITYALPVGLIVPMILPLPISKFTVCVIVLSIIIIQNLIFYFEMRKYDNENVQDKKLFFTKKKITILSIIGSLAIITSFVYFFIINPIQEMNKIHNENLNIIEQCYEDVNNFEEVNAIVITKEDNHSPVSCEKK